MNTSKEIAKFFAGFAFNEVLAHTVLGIGGFLPWKLGKLGFTLTPGINMAITIFWLVAFPALVYYGWFYKK